MNFTAPFTSMYDGCPADIVMLCQEKGNTQVLGNSIQGFRLEMQNLTNGGSKQYGLLSSSVTIMALFNKSV